MHLFAIFSALTGIFFHELQERIFAVTQNTVFGLGNGMRVADHCLENSRKGIFFETTCTECQSLFHMFLNASQLLYSTKTIYNSFFTWLCISLKHKQNIDCQSVR